MPVFKGLTGWFLHFRLHYGKMLEGYLPKGTTAMKYMSEFNTRLNLECSDNMLVSTWRNALHISTDEVVGVPLAAYRIFYDNAPPTEEEMQRMEAFAALQDEADDLQIQLDSLTDDQIGASLVDDMIDELADDANDFMPDDDNYFPTLELDEFGNDPDEYDADGNDVGDISDEDLWERQTRNAEALEAAGFYDEPDDDHGVADAIHHSHRGYEMLVQGNNADYAQAKLALEQAVRDLYPDLTDEQWKAIEKATEKYQGPGGEIVSGEPWPIHPQPFTVSKMLDEVEKKFDQVANERPVIEDTPNQTPYVNVSKTRGPYRLFSLMDEIDPNFGRAHIPSVAPSNRFSDAKAVFDTLERKHHDYVVYTLPKLRGSDWSDIAKPDHVRGMRAARKAINDARAEGKYVAIIDNNGNKDSIPHYWMAIAERVILGGVVIKDRFIPEGTLVEMDDNLRSTGLVTHRLKDDDKEKITEIASRIFRGSKEVILYHSASVENPMDYTKLDLNLGLPGGSALQSPTTVRESLAGDKDSRPRCMICGEDQAECIGAGGHPDHDKTLG